MELSLTIRLGDYSEKIGRGATPRGGKEVYQESGIALIRSQNVYNNYFSFDGLAHINNQQAEKLDNVTVETDDILLNITGDSVARVCQVPSYVLPARVNQHVAIIRPDKKYLDPAFVRYFLVSPQMQAHMLILAGSGATRKALTKGMIEDFQIPAISLPEQRAIAHILGSLDDKIEANRRQNETLEATARAIFKSWFVDFDPVHAKGRGEHPPGMDAATAALFPDSFEESELGLIPRGWQVVPIGDHIKASKGLSYKGAHLQETIEDGLPMHNLNSVNEWGGYKFDGIKFYSGDYKPRHEVRPGDLIVANTEQGFNLLLIASPAIVPAVFGEKGIISHHIYKVEIKRKSPLTRLFLYYTIMLSPFRDVLQGYTNGTTVNMLPSDAFEKPRFVMPPAELMQRFDALVAPMLEQVERNYEKSTTLAETRDALLPRLVSRKIRVGEVE